MPPKPLCIAFCNPSKYADALRRALIVLGQLGGSVRAAKASGRYPEAMAGEDLGELEEAELPLQMLLIALDPDQALALAESQGATPTQLASLKRVTDQVLAARHRSGNVRVDA